MILIIGGAYQGKLDYAKETYGLKDDEIFDCAEANDNGDWPSIDLKAKAFNHFERYILACTREGIEAAGHVEASLEELKDKIILADDVTQGVVPMDKLERAWREETGRSLVILGKEAEKVIRVFCGIPYEIKGSGKY
ncbi:MAG: bifunctional adenosylcobinamide kinase/adenosylcobinamide-phosphate guanylyltransferase [Hornefia sp.]|nr:bifunctional adenosylcobinamide kinase/adenosylcobinamide-phosphate guanylyltransferase [Hornefia sp.]